MGVFMPRTSPPILQAHGGGQIRRLLGWSPGLRLGRHGHQTTLGGARKTVDGIRCGTQRGSPDVFTVSVDVNLLLVVGWIFKSAPNGGGMLERCETLGELFRGRGG